MVEEEEEIEEEVEDVEEEVADLEDGVEEMEDEVEENGNISLAGWMKMRMYHVEVPKMFQI